MDSLVLVITLEKEGPHMATPSTDAIRVQKYLSEQGVSSRREAEKLIQEGYVTVNGKKIELGHKVVPGMDAVSVRGKLVGRRKAPKVYWLFNKPDMTLCSKVGQGGKDTIFQLPELAKIPFHFFSVGRLDYRSEGLLLLTNDGDLSEKLTHPKYAVERTYQVLITGKLTREEEQQLKQGIKLEDGVAKVSHLLYAHGKNLGKSRGSWYFVTVQEGRNRLVRRLFEHLEHKVVRLIRVSYGPIKLPEELLPGALKQLSAKEIHALKTSFEP